MKGFYMFVWFFWGGGGVFGTIHVCKANNGSSCLPQSMQRLNCFTFKKFPGQSGRLHANLCIIRSCIFLDCKNLQLRLNSFSHMKDTSHPLSKAVTLLTMMLRGNGGLLSTFPNTLQCNTKV